MIPYQADKVHFRVKVYIGGYPLERSVAYLVP